MTTPKRLQEFRKQYADTNTYWGSFDDAKGELSEQQFREALARWGFRPERVEGFYTIIWDDDGTPKMGVSVLNVGSSRRAQLSHLIDAYQRYRRKYGLPDTPPWDHR